MIRAAVLSVLLLTGCATAPAEEVPLGPQSPEGRWVISRIAGQSAEGEGTVHFHWPAVGGVSGRTPCNSFGAQRYTLAGSRILVEDATMTLMACADPARQERERIFTDVLFESPHFVIYGDQMLLTGPSGDVVELRRAAK